MWTKRRSSNTTHRRSIDDHRSPYERDLTRVIHSPAFRKLQRKTQILGTNEGDFHRTRLTHSLEVSSIAKSIVRNLKRRDGAIDVLPSDDLISTISLLHDIGHPPFGHGGEVALNYMMRNHGGFEGNGQTLRLITKCEVSYGDCGLDLTRRTLLGTLKYPSAYKHVNKLSYAQHKDKLPLKINDWLPPKCFFDSEQHVVDWILKCLPENDQRLFQKISPKPTKTTHGKALYKSLDCSIMNIADDIAYGVHDFEDAIHLKLISKDALQNQKFIDIYNQANLDKQLPDCELMVSNLFNREQKIRKSAIGELVNFFITSTSIQQPESHQCFETSLLRNNAIMKCSAQTLLDEMISLIYGHVIDSPEARTIEYGGQTVVLKLFEAINSNPLSLMDRLARKRYENATSENEGLRVISDYISNMSDEYAYRMHERLFGFNTRTVFERI